MNPEVSIITPSYNSSGYIGTTIKSVLSQSFENWEMIIVDDASTDDSSEVIQQYSKIDSRIKLFVLDENVGSGNTRNVCIDKAKGRYLAFLDADDYWKPDKLEKQISFMKINKYHLTYTEYYEFNNETGNIETHIKSPKKVSRNMILMNGGFIGCLTVIYDTSFFGKRYMPKIRKRQDWATWIKMLKDIDFAYGIQEPLAYYRKGNSSLSQRKIYLLKHNFMVYRKELGMSLFKSVYYMTRFLIYHFFFKHHWRKAIKS